jgi:hypothetical protein
MILPDAEIEQFMADGYVVLRRGVSREVAAEGRAELFSNDPFDRILNPRLEVALDQIMGPGRATIHDHFGWWPVLFPGFKGSGGWHRFPLLRCLARRRWHRGGSRLTTP